MIPVIPVKDSQLFPGQLLDVSPPPDCVLSCFETVTEDHVASLITSSAIKCCPLDPAPAVIFKECVSVILPVITKIVNLSINSCVVPDCFKVAMLNPLLKKMGLDSRFLRILDQSQI